MNATKTITETYKALALNDEETLVFLNHHAVQDFRAFCWDRDMDPAAVAAYEAPFALGFDLETYTFEASRVGRQYCLNRKARLALWVLLKTRAALEA